MSTSSWYIHKNGQTLGPMSAAEIRLGLRDGTLDPFDLVSKDGSTVRREIVEVDEIFSQAMDAALDSDPVPGGGGGDDLIRPSGSSPLAGRGALMLAASEPAERGRGELLGAAAAPQQPRRRRNPRSFHVQDAHGRVLGPMSASEIRSLFFKGVLDKRVRVMRDGSPAKVPVAKFVAAYSEARRSPQSPMQQAAHPSFQAGLRPSGAAAQLAFAQGTGGGYYWQPWAIGGIVAASVIVAILAAWVAFTKSGQDWLARRSGRDNGAETRGAGTKGRSGQVSGKRDPGIGTGRLPRPGLRPTVKPTPPTRVSPPRQEQPRRQPTREAVRKRPEAVRKTQPVTPVASYKQAPRPLPVKPLPAVKPPPPKPLPVASPPPKPAPTASPLTAGKSVTGYGPMRYNPAAVESCPVSCTLTMQGPNGSVKVAFFKKVWGPTLQAKKGSARINGFVRDMNGQLVIMLSAVN